MASSPGGHYATSVDRMPGPLHGARVQGGNVSWVCRSEPSIVATRELRGRGVTRAGIAAALRSGEFMRVRRGVYSTLDACPLAIRAAAHGGALACASAARHLGLWVLESDPRPHVWMGAGGHRRHDEGCGCIEHWDDGPPRDAFGMPSVPRILRQMLGCLGVEAFFVALESARRQGRLTRTGLDWLRANTNATGRKAITLSRADADSGLESLLRWRLRAHRLRVRTQVKIRGVGRVDVLIGERLIVETDGRDNHDPDSHRHRDLVRDANAAAQGYRTLRFDYALVVHNWDLVEAAIIGAIVAGHHLAA
ncbi:conserved hypothetical protein [uncultured Microbacterium sp.]|uniref:DUF559 domain-containing protein n=1 Tax=uncultured Microbacterium sp. TaxID=191216 RepID=A0A1Y5NU34_9MICO|nr:conserved hypothetical protein [uncultured Microbacterium sp.]